MEPPTGNMEKSGLNKPGFIVHWENSGIVSILRLKGDLTGPEVQAWKEELRGRIEKENPRLLLDFRNLETLSSDALGALLSAAKRARDNGGDLKIVNLPPFVSEVFSATRLLRVFEIFNDETVALRSFSGNN